MQAFMTQSAADVALPRRQAQDPKTIATKTPIRNYIKIDNIPLARTKRQSNGTAAKRKSNGVKKEESDSNAPISKKTKPVASTRNIMKAES
ncbi:hypothetical protein ACHAP7_005635 [Fusarium lateritium]